MQLPYFQIDAFASAPFQGNPAAVVLLTEWLPEPLLQSMAGEHGLSETAFLVPLPPGSNADYHLRWFTPVQEVELCGHATLASAHVVLTQLVPSRQAVSFSTQSGVLQVARDGRQLMMVLPSRPAQVEPFSEELCGALRARPREVLLATDLMVVFPSAAQVRALRPNLEALCQLEPAGFIATAPGTDCDFVSRYFAPRQGLPEDSVTGSAHCTLVPYWADRLGKLDLSARQVSDRGGALRCRLRGDQVLLTGDAVTYLIGTLHC